MGNNHNNRTKHIVAAGVFILVVGGGIISFVISQGKEDLWGVNKGGFFYSFAESGAGVPWAKYFSLDEYPAGKVRYRRIDPALVAKADAAAGVRPAGKGSPGEENLPARGAVSPQPIRQTVVPAISALKPGSIVSGGGSMTAAGKMSAAGSGTATAAGKAGGVKTSAGGGFGNVKVSDGRPGAQEGAKGREGALGVLNGARALTGEGAKSGSAMTASAKWGQAFGERTGTKSGNLTYSNPGLVKLDATKSGEIESLKTAQAPAMDSKAARDQAAEAKDETLNKMKGQEGAQAAKEAMTESAGQVAGQAAQGAVDPATGGNVEVPPQSVIDAATTPPPKGTYCPGGCGEGAEFYKDSSVSYEKNAEGGWDARFKGVQDGKNYIDRVGIEPGPPPVMTPKETHLQDKPGGPWKKAAEAGGNVAAQ